jgi:predicted amidohydrolase
VKIAVLQHLMRTHERMDLAALLSLSEQAEDEGADVIVYPCVPGLGYASGLMTAFASNVIERAPQVSIVGPCAVRGREGRVEAVPTRLGRALVLAGDDCIDDALYPDVEGLGLEALVWQMDTESPLQAEALLELALDASLSQAGLVLTACLYGEARGVSSFGGSAIVHLGEILAEAGDGEDLLLADVPIPVALPERRGRRAIPAPILQQRLAVHHGKKLRPGYPATID